MTFLWEISLGQTLNMVMLFILTLVLYISRASVNGTMMRVGNLERQVCALRNDIEHLRTTLDAG